MDPVLDPAFMFITWSTVAGVALFAFVRWGLPRLLARRGVIMRRTGFGVTLIFESADDDGTPVRLLNVNGTFQSVTYVEPRLRYELVCQYHRTFAEVVRHMPRLRRAAVVGGGGFSFPKWLLAHAAPAQVDVVEIDPRIIAIAREFFYLDEAEAQFGDRLNVACDDGWAWLRAQREPFDLLVNDAFSGKKPLGPLATDEGARLVRTHLSEDGIYAANVRASLEGHHAAPLLEVARAFSHEFSHVWLVPENPNEPERLGYNALVASNLATVMPDEALAWSGDRWVATR